jgi:hypothetical protein
VATPNYGYDKRQKELAKKKKKEEKLKHKAERKVGEGAEDGAVDDVDADEASADNPDSPT